VQVDIEGAPHDAFVKATQRDIKTGQILHVDFYEVESGKPLKARVPLRITGNPVGVRAGGVLEIALHQVEVECLPKDLPPRIDVDIAGLNVNESIHVEHLKLADSVKLITSPDQVIALVKFMKEEAVAAPAEAEAAATAEGATPGAEAPADAKSAPTDAKAADAKGAK
jgi:large subunit ribosomal protein L25